MQDHRVTVWIAKYGDVTNARVPCVVDELNASGFKLDSCRRHLGDPQGETGLIGNEWKTFPFWLPEDESHVRRLQFAVRRIAVR